MSPNGPSSARPDTGGTAGLAAGVPALRGKRIVVSGSSEGIGRAVARRLGREGARVVVNGSGLGAGGRDASARRLESLVREIETLGGEATFYVGSIDDADAAAALIETAVESFGGLDGLVNCAGVAEPEGSTIRAISGSAWRRVLAVHLDGTFQCCRHAVPYLVAAGGGAIVNTSSHAFLGLYGGTAYAAAKGATNALTRAMAADLRTEGVRCNAICPGAKTRLSSGEAHAAKIADLEARGLLSPELAQRSLDPPPPEGVAALYAFLLSDAAAGISGEVFSAAGPYVGIFPRPEEKLLAFDAPRGGGDGTDSAGGGSWEIAELARRLADALGSR